MRQAFIYYFLSILFLLTTFRCNSQVKSFDEIGGILYTFNLPEETTLNDVEQIKYIFSSRIAAFVRQIPKYIYDEEHQELSVGVPLSLTSKNPDLTRELLLTEGSFRTIPEYKTSVKYILDSINARMEREDLILESSDDSEEVLEYDLYDYLKQEAPTTFNYGYADYSDTTIVNAILVHDDFSSLFEAHPNLTWVWREDKGRVSLHPYERSIWNNGVKETMIKSSKLVDTDYGGWQLQVEFNEVGRKIFLEQTTKAYTEQKMIHFFIDNDLMMSSHINNPIDVGKTTIAFSNDDQNMERLFFLKAIVDASKIPVWMELIDEEER